MSQGQYVVVAYGAAFVVVLAYVAIIAAKLVRLRREVEKLLELAARGRAAPGPLEAEPPVGEALRP